MYRSILHCIYNIPFIIYNHACSHTASSQWEGYNILRVGVGRRDLGGDMPGCGRTEKSGVWKNFFAGYGSFTEVTGVDF